MNENIAKIIDGFKYQAQWCHKLGSPLTAYICEQVILHINKNQKLQTIMQPFVDNMRPSAAALRFTGAINALVLQGRADQLKPYYLDGEVDYLTIWQYVEQLIEIEYDHFVSFVIEAPQTNEVGRSSVLLAAFSEISKHTKLPINLYELGASAGLNLMFDQFYYHMNEQNWGNAQSRVKLNPQWTGDDVDLKFNIEINQRNGCDLNPLDVNNEQDLLCLRSYIWPDMIERKQRFEAAVSLAKQFDVKVDKADAAIWLREKLRKLSDGHAHVIYHTIAWQYFPGTVKTELNDMIELAGSLATIDRPIIHLYFEFNYKEGAAIGFRIWNGDTLHGDEFKLGTAHPHGAEIIWKKT